MRQTRHTVRATRSHLSLARNRLPLRAVRHQCLRVTSIRVATDPTDVSSRDSTLDRSESPPGAPAERLPSVSMRSRRTEARPWVAGATTVQLRRNRDFVLLLTGRLLSTLGSQVTAIAYPLLVLAVTGSPAKAGFVGFAGLVPHAVLGLPAGVAADRWNRKRLMIVADAVRAVAIARARGDDRPRPGHVLADRGRRVRRGCGSGRSSTPLTPARSARSSRGSSCPRPSASSERAVRR